MIISPITPVTVGTSFINKKAKIIVMAGFNELIGPNTDNSVVCNDLTSRILPIPSKSEAKIIFCQNSMLRAE